MPGRRAPPAAAGPRRHASLGLSATPRSRPSSSPCRRCSGRRSAHRPPQAGRMPVSPLAGAGAPCGVVVPSPSCPLPFSPQHKTPPAVSIPHALALASARLVKVRPTAALAGTARPRRVERPVAVPPGSYVSPAPSLARCLQTARQRRADIHVLEQQGTHSDRHRIHNIPGSRSDHGGARRGRRENRSRSDRATAGSGDSHCDRTIGQQSALAIKGSDLQLQPLPGQQGIEDWGDLEGSDGRGIARAGRLTAAPGEHRAEKIGTQPESADSSSFAPRASTARQSAPIQTLGPSRTAHSSRRCRRRGSLHRPTRTAA